jgi:hypothetical protein
MKDADFSKWTKPDDIARLLKEWADKKDYPKELFYKV